MLTSSGSAEGTAAGCCGGGWASTRDWEGAVLGSGEPLWMVWVFSCARAADEAFTRTAARLGGAKYAAPALWISRSAAMSINIADQRLR